MGTDFVLQEKWTIFLPKRCLRVYLELYVLVCPKCTSKYFYMLVLFIPKHPIVDAFLVKNPPKSCKTNFCNKQLKALAKIHLKYEFEKV